jgi:hypothetical protein
MSNSLLYKSCKTFPKLCNNAKGFRSDICIVNPLAVINEKNQLIINKIINHINIEKKELDSPIASPVFYRSGLGFT